MVIKDSWDYEGQKVTIIWHEASDFENLSPITQVYGLCFNSENKILVIKDEDWLIPGGKPEGEESLTETLQRELWEEARVRVKNPGPIGYNEVHFPKNPNKKEGELFYQVRFACLLDEVEEMGEDPATGKTYRRKFIAPEKFTDFVQWGDTGQAMLQKALEIVDKLRN